VRVIDFGEEFLIHSQMNSEQVIQKYAIFSQVIHRTEELVAGKRKSPLEAGSDIRQRIGSSK
jgi:hypothetical protein